jgi:hypothetical protein
MITQSAETTTNPERQDNFFNNNCKPFPAKDTASVCKQKVRKSNTVTGHKNKKWY